MSCPVLDCPSRSAKYILSLGYLTGSEDYYTHFRPGDAVTSKHWLGYDLWENDAPFWPAIGNYSVFVFNDKINNIIDKHDQNKVRKGRRNQNYVFKCLLSIGLLCTYWCAQNHCPFFSFPSPFHHLLFCQICIRVHRRCSKLVSITWAREQREQREPKSHFIPEVSNVLGRASRKSAQA